MISAHAVKSSSSAEFYYGADNYYTKEQGLENSQWFGKGADAQELSGQIKLEDFRSNLSGQIDGQQLGRTVKDENGDAVIQHRPAYDFTFSAPKSVSIMSEVYQDETLRDAHERAVQTTLGYIESDLIQSRVMVDGEQTYVNTKNMTVAMFQHNTSRELDPQTHTHALIMNATQDEDGKWRSIESRNLFESQKIIGAIYNSELAKEVVKAGYAIEVRDQKGNFEIVGIERDQIEAFSQRRAQIEESLKSRGIDIDQASAQQKEDATLNTRVSKRDVDHDELVTDWKDRATEMSLDGDYLKAQAALNRLMPDQSKSEQKDDLSHANQALDFAIKHLTEREAVVSKDQIQVKAMEHGLGQASALDIMQAFKQREAEGDLKQLPNGHYTSRQMMNSESWTVDQIKDHRGASGFILSQDDALEKINQAQKEQGFLYTEGQKQSIVTVLTTGDRYIAIQGLAGTGKTTMLKGLKNIAQDADYKVRGLAATGAASKVLGQETGIPTDTISMFLIKERKIQADLASQEKDPDLKRQPELWVVDESSFIGQRDMQSVMRMAEKADARVVFLGDKLQLQSITAGKPFELVQAHDIETAQMTEINRQKTNDMKAVVSTIVGQQTDSQKNVTVLDKQQQLNLDRNKEALTLLDTQGRVIEEAKENEVPRVVQDYVKLDAQSRQETLIITPFNADRIEINQAVREQLKAKGELSTGQETDILRSKNMTNAERLSAQYFSAGDVVRFGKDYKNLGVKKDEYWTVSDQKSPTMHSLMIVNQQGETKEWIPSKTSKTEVYQSEKRELSQGDQIRFTRNNPSLKNGEMGKVERLDGRNAVVSVESAGQKQEHVVNLDQDKHWDHAYSITVFSSQGLTKNTTMLYVKMPEKETDSQKQANQVKAIGQIFGDRGFYVAATRASHDFKVYTNDKAAMSELVGIKQDKTSVLDVINQYVPKEKNENTVKGFDRER